MEHWFDRLTKSLATTGLSRRNLVRSAAASGSWIILPPTGRAASAFAQFREAAPANPSACEVQGQGGDAVITYSARGSYRGQALTLRGFQARRGRKRSSLRSEVRIELDGKLVMDVFRRITPAFDAKGRPRTPTIRTNLKYGAAVEGVRSVTAVARGEQVQGFADGLAFSADRAPEAPLRFKTPRPQPATQIDPELADAIRRLFWEADRNLQTCPVRGETSRAAVIRNPLRQLVSLTSPEVLAQNAPSQGPCDDCLYKCDETFAGCTGGVAVGCVESFGIGCLALIKCYSDYQSCGGDCDKPGGPCCDVGCPNGGCCPTDNTCCGDTCCWSGTTCATATTDTGDALYDCCPSSAPNLQILGYVYSQQYENEVLEVVCCPNGTTGCSGDSCCNSDQYCADPFYGVCCPKGQSLCAGSCCDGTCLTYSTGNQVCCPKPNAVCGSTDVGPVCCAPGNCQTSDTGKKVCCAYPPLCGEVCCESPATCSNGRCGINPCGDTFCGFNHCCNGVCCEFNQTCVDGRCTNTTCPAGEVPCPVTPGQCCPPNTTCCANGKCCDPNTTECCGARGCVPIGTCIQ